MPKRTARAKKGSKSSYNRVLFVAFFVFSLGFLGVYGFHTLIDKRPISANSTSSFDLLAEEIVTFLYVSTSQDLSEEPLFTTTHILFIVDKKDRKVAAIELPAELNVDIAGKFGQEPLSRAVAIGSLAGGSLDAGLMTLIATIEKLVATHIDGYILAANSLRDTFDPLFMDDATGYLNWTVLSQAPKLTTNMSLRELYDITSLLKVTSETDFVRYAVSLEDISTSEVLEASLRDLAYNSPVALEKKSIAVLNGSKVPNVAGFGAQLIENAGGRVIAVENAEDFYKTSVLIVDDRFSKTAEYLIRAFNVDTVFLKNETSIEEMISSRADIVLVLGLDIAEKL